MCLNHFIEKDVSVGGKKYTLSLCKNNKEFTTVFSDNSKYRCILPINTQRKLKNIV